MKNLGGLGLVLGTNLTDIGVAIVISGELLLDQQRFQDAVEKFDRAVELEELK